MNPEVARAIPELEREGHLRPGVAATLLRLARGDLVPVRTELRALLYAGVLTATAGIGLLVKDRIAQLGPLAIATAIGLAAAICLAWVARTAPPASRGEQASSHLAFDYVLLLGALLVAADLAFVEVQFSPLGDRWPLHLLIVAALHAGLAFRYDSALLFSLALSSFAAWRGVAVTTFGSSMWARSSGDLVRVNAIACGVLFVLVGWGLLRLRSKPHFEPTATYLGWALILGALMGGMGDVGYGSGDWRAWTALLLLVAVGLAAGAAAVRRFPLFAMAIVAAYVALCRFVLEALHGVEPVLAWFAGSGAALVVALVLAQRRLREQR